MIRDLLAALGTDGARRYRGYLVLVTAYAVVQGLAVATLVPIARALFTTVDGGSTAPLWRALLVTGALVVVASVLHYLQAMSGYGAALGLMRTLHERIGDKLARLPLGWFLGARLGEVSQLASKGTLSIMGTAAHLMTPVLVGIITPATIVVAATAFDWRRGLTLTLGGAVLWAAARVSATLLARTDSRTHAAAVEADNRVLEFARNQRALRAFGQTREIYPPLATALVEEQAAARAAMWSSVIGSIATRTALQLVFTAPIALGAWLVLHGGADAVTVFALLGLTARFVGPASDVADLAGALGLARADLARFAALLAEPEQPQPDSSAGWASDSAPAVEFEAVDFGYDERPVLRGITASVPRGSLTAIVGPSGSGKTTATRLIARFWDVDAGAVRVGGVDVREQTTEDLMAQLSLVFQDVYLFDDTLEANIRTGRPDATAEQVRAAAATAGVLEIVDRLPDGWDTQVGEGGAALSGGERQRVSIARALLKDAPIVLLDEATAALDPENERHVTDAIGRLRERATVIVIAHQLSTVVAADRILVLAADGTLTQQGTHDELLAVPGVYADFWAARTSAAGWSLVQA